MTPASSKALMVAIGLGLAGVAETLRQNDVVPAHWAWALDLAILVGGYLKGAALQKRPGDEKAS